MVSVGGPGHGERAPERRMPYESAAATRKAQRLRSAHSCPAGEDVAPRAPAAVAPRPTAAVAPRPPAADTTIRIVVRAPAAAAPRAVKRNRTWEIRILIEIFWLGLGWGLSQCCSARWGAVWAGVGGSVGCSIRIQLRVGIRRRITYPRILAHLGIRIPDT